jgi:hypothetical protein
MPKRFKKGRTSVDGEDRSGQPSTETTTEKEAEVREIILEDRRRTIYDVCNIVGLSYGTCLRILSDEPNMRRIAAKFVPRLTTLRLTRRSLFSSLWVLRIRQSSPTLQIHRTSPSCDAFLFPKMKLKLKGRRFHSIKEIQTVSQRVIKTLKRNDFQKCFRSWKSRWNRCINTKGN